MQKLLISIYCLILTLFITNSVIANSEVVVEKNGNITNYYAKQDPIRYAQSIVEMSPAEKKKLYKYAMANPDKVTPITYIALADYIYHTSKEDALFWYFVGRIRATEDIMMCTDESASQQVAYYPMLAEDTMSYFRELGKNASRIMAKAVDWDEQHPQRVNPKWACYHGMQVFMLGDVTTKPMSEYKKIQEDYRARVRKSLK